MIKIDKSKTISDEQLKEARKHLREVNKLLDSEDTKITIIDYSKRAKKEIRERIKEWRKDEQKTTQSGT